MLRASLMAAAAAVAVGTMSALVLAPGQGRPASPMGSSAIEIGAKMGQDYPARQVDRGDPRPSDPSRARHVWKRGQLRQGGQPGCAGLASGRQSVDSAQDQEVTAEIINGRTVAPGTYTMLVDLKPNNWTLIISSWQKHWRSSTRATRRRSGAGTVHPRQRHRARADDARNAAAIARTAVVGVRGRQQHRRHAGAVVGQAGGVGPLQGGLTFPGPESARTIGRAPTAKMPSAFDSVVQMLACSLPLLTERTWCNDQRRAVISRFCARWTSVLSPLPRSR